MGQRAAKLVSFCTRCFTSFSCHRGDGGGRCRNGAQTFSQRGDSEVSGRVLEQTTKETGANLDSIVFSPAFAFNSATVMPSRSPSFSPPRTIVGRIAGMVSAKQSHCNTFTFSKSSSPSSSPPARLHKYTQIAVDSNIFSPDASSTSSGSFPTPATPACSSRSRIVPCEGAQENGREKFPSGVLA